MSLARDKGSLGRRSFTSAVMLRVCRVELVIGSRIYASKLILAKEGLLNWGV